MTICPVQQADLQVRLSAFDHAGSDSCADEVSFLVRSRFDGPRRILSLDLQALTDLSRPISQDAVLHSIWYSIRQTIEIFPIPRHGHRQAVAAGIVRQEIESHAIAMLDADGVDEIVDRRLESALAAIPAGPASGEQEVVSMETGWGPRRRPDGRMARSQWPWAMLISGATGLVIFGVLLLLAKLESALVLASGITLASIPMIQTRLQRSEQLPRRADPFGSETIKVGRGWLETASGRRRRRDEVVTMVFRESENNQRIEVRIIGPTRVVRLRFESLQDLRFVEFWRRWSGFQTDAISRRAG